VMRAPSVPYGLGKVKRPRCGTNDAICAEVMAGRVDDEVAESMKPPDCADASFAAMAKTEKAIETIDRRVPWDTTSLLPARQTGTDTALAAKFQ
jgi:hypothetical protein